MERNFKHWISQFRYSISDYKYYTDFKKVYNNVNAIKVELNILNSLIGSTNIEKDFEILLSSYPQILKCIPILLAIRSKEIYALGLNGGIQYNFEQINLTVEEYKIFMRETGLFNLISNHIIHSLVDYVMGVETGLDSNARKNRGGHLMESLVERFIQKEGLMYKENYFKEMYVHDISNLFGIDLSSISNQGKREKRFDFVIITEKQVYALETNFYNAGGSKLNETARSYKHLALESKKLRNLISFGLQMEGVGCLQKIV